jgi:large subunit ribosomal protein L18
LKEKGKLSEKARKVGASIATSALGKKIKMVSFDRGGFAYKGSIKIFADSAREKGLEF